MPTLEDFYILMWTYLARDQIDSIPVPEPFGVRLQVRSKQPVVRVFVYADDFAAPFAQNRHIEAAYYLSIVNACRMFLLQELEVLYLSQAIFCVLLRVY